MRIQQLAKRLGGKRIVFSLIIVAFMVGTPAMTAVASTGSDDTPAVVDAPAVVDLAIQLSLVDDDAVPPLPFPDKGDPVQATDEGYLMNKFCYYESKVDNPHISANRRDVSTHGYWIYHNGTCSTATVKIWLYHARWNSLIGDYWALTDYDVVHNMPSNPPVSGRANARHRCATQDRPVTFVAIVDVDIDDHSDPSDRPQRTAHLNCVPW